MSQHQSVLTVENAIPAAEAEPAQVRSRSPTDARAPRLTEEAPKHRRRSRSAGCCWSARAFSPSRGPVTSAGSTGRPAASRSRPMMPMSRLTARRSRRRSPATSPTCRWATMSRSRPARSSPASTTAISRWPLSRPRPMSRPRRPASPTNRPSSPPSNPPSTPPRRPLSPTRPTRPSPSRTTSATPTSPRGDSARSERPASHCAHHCGPRRRHTGHRGTGERGQAARRAQGELAQAQAALARARPQDQAELNLSYTALVSPVDGVIGNRTLRVGQYVQAGTPLMAVVPTEAAYIVANYKETQLTDVHPGQSVEVQVTCSPASSSTAASTASRPRAGRNSRCCRPTTPPATSPRWCSASPPRSPSTPASRPPWSCGRACRSTRRSASRPTRPRITSVPVGQS